jgi:mRNA interferase MazF
MRRGEVWWVTFGPGRGGEIRKTRPAVIVSNDDANRNLNRIQVVPLTGTTSRLYSSEAIVNIRNRTSKAMADQLTTVAKERVGSAIGTVTATELRAIERAIRNQLDLI